MSTSTGNTGPLGKQRGIGFAILLFILTLGIYGLYWVYKTQEEMKQHTGDGIGGVVGLVVWILLTPVSAFVIPSEVGNMHAKAGKQKPTTGWTGLWLFPFGILVIPAIVWFVLIQAALNNYWRTGEAPSPLEPAAPPRPASSGASLALVFVAVLAAYLLGFALLNDDYVQIDFGLDTRDIPVRLLVLLCVALGFVAGALLHRALRQRAAER